MTFTFYHASLLLALEKVSYEMSLKPSVFFLKKKNWNIFFRIYKIIKRKYINYYDNRTKTRRPQSVFLN
jgi:hypothetical protein